MRGCNDPFSTIAERPNLPAVNGLWQNRALSGDGTMFAADTDKGFGRHNFLASRPQPSQEMKRSTPSHRCRMAVLLTLIVSVLVPKAFSAESAPSTTAPIASSSSATIVIGFVGGFVHRDDARHSEVQLVEKLRQMHANRVHAEIFRNRHIGAAHRAILKWLDRDEDGNLSPEERRGARIILYGHSWGASAAIALARQLAQENIPILLTVQVDSIAKNGQDDQFIPANVAKAINFYQTRGLLHGRTRIAASDPAHTEILGDFRFDYQKQPTECAAYPWVDRHLFKGHTSIECDPQVWSKIETMIDYYLPSESASVPADTLADAKLAKTKP